MVVLMDVVDVEVVDVVDVVEVEVVVVVGLTSFFSTRPMTASINDEGRNREKSGKDHRLTGSYWQAF